MRFFIDMDDTITDFAGHFRKNFGLYPFEYKTSLIEYLRDLGASHDRSHEVFVRSFWDAINNCEKNFWENIPPTKLFKPLLKHIKHHEVIIITAVPITFPECTIASVGKRNWVNKYIGKNTPMLILPLFNDNLNVPKYKFCHHLNDILIDDNKDIIEKWIEKGGTGILHKNEDTDNTITHLKDYIKLYQGK